MSTAASRRSTTRNLLRLAVLSVLVLGCSSSSSPTAAMTDAGAGDASSLDAGCTALRPGALCHACGGDVAVTMECRDGNWKCPAGTREHCDATCTGVGPICCAAGAPPSEPTCTGSETWQCAPGTTPTSRATGCPTPDAGADASADAGPCAAAATTEACVTCCRQPDAPNYGGFELYAFDVCNACSACKGLSPCGTNVTPAAGKTCVECLQTKMSASGVPAMCTSDGKCKSFAACLATCPLK